MNKDCIFEKSKRGNDYMRTLLILFVSLYFPIHALASDAQLTYPELLVTPRASERIQMEAKTEKSSRMTQHLPLQISSLMTLVSGLYSQSNKPDPSSVNPDDAKWASNAAIGVGAAWLIGSYILSESYTPYTKAVGVLQAMPTKTPQETLARERIAEEHIEAAGKTGDRIMWASAITNLAASAYLAGKSSRDGAVFAGVSGLLAFSPLVFRYNWQTVSQYHQDYKKKIYGPIAMPMLMETHSRFAKNEFVPGVSWLLSF
jgi:hypothetical protein